MVFGAKAAFKTPEAQFASPIWGLAAAFHRVFTAARAIPADM
jgi:hypothetical protein